MPAGAPDLVELSDPRAIRALAHPIRLAILELLRLEGSANATECARSIDESPQSCSYHLRTLGKWGFAQRVETADARETRWKASAGGFRFGGGAGVPPELDSAATLLTDRVLERDEQVLRAFMQNADDLEPEWRDSAQFTSASLYVTSGELEELKASTAELLQKYRRPKDDRPPGSRRVHVVFRAVPHVDQPRKRRSES